MRAVICDRYGPPNVLRLADVERPVPTEDEPEGSERNG
jgi:NADPH:quinone reductase-like Zn-dependent oxidoreductase